MEIRAIIFDKDGTIANFGVTFNKATKLVLDEICNGDTELMERAAEALDYDLSSSRIGDRSVIIAGTGIDIAEALFPVLPIEDTVIFGSIIDEMYGEICLNMVEALPGAVAALEALHEAGFILGVATNDSEENAVSQMEALEVDHLFEHIFGSDSGFGPKPDSGMVDAFVDRLNLPPKEVLMVGDSLHDMQAGRAAGVHNCAVETGPATRDVLSAHADIILPSIAELPQALIASKR